MARHELIMPKMGESVAEATIISWNKEIGDTIEIDEPILEIATDKVDSEVPSPVEGKLIEKLFEVDAVVNVGDVVAIIETEGEATGASSASAAQPVKAAAPAAVIATQVEEIKQTVGVAASQDGNTPREDGDRFYSPLVRSIADTEGIALNELQAIAGTGSDGRVTKEDVLGYLGNRDNGNAKLKAPAKSAPSKASTAGPTISVNGEDEIIAMDRMRKLIADHMVMSKHTSPHVTSFVEADVTNIVNWRNKVKDGFLKREKEKITYTPIFIEAVCKAIRDLPMINVSVDGTNIIKRGRVNIGMATALPSGNLIVPVIKDADRMNLVGITKSVNDLANRARNNKLGPDEVSGGTFTVTNVGSFGNVMGTPIINQPQAAILAVGAIKKKPAVIETPEGDLIGIRHFMFLSLSYDHRVVDGSLGGSFVRKVADYLESFDPNQEY